MRRVLMQKSAGVVSYVQKRLLTALCEQAKLCAQKMATDQDIDRLMWPPENGVLFRRARWFAGPRMY